MMLEAFKDFKEVFASLTDRGEGAKPEVGPMHEVKMAGSMDAVEEAMKNLLGMDDDENEDWDSDCLEDFPCTTHFKFEDINADDPRFATGLQVGIPYAVAVRNEDGQGMLIPIKNGMFDGGY